MPIEWSQEKLIKAMVANLNVQMTHFAQYLNQVELIRIPGLPSSILGYMMIHSTMY